MKKFNMEVVAASRATKCYGERIAIMDNFGALLPNAPYPFVFEGMLFGIVTRGHNSFMLDKQRYTLGPGDIFTSFPQNLMEDFRFSDDIEATAVFIDGGYLEELYDKVTIDWNMRLMAMSHTPLHADETETKRIVTYMQQIAEKLNSPVGPFRNDCIQSLLLSLAYDVFDLRMRSFHVNDKPAVKYSSAERLFYSFVKMLNDPHEQFLNVNGYSERLHITPKYFSTICRELTGKTAGQIINEEVIRTAKVMLHDKAKSIRQISEELNFANQSHFASFFHRHVGLSPQRFRNQMTHE